MVALMRIVPLRETVDRFYTNNNVDGEPQFANTFKLENAAETPWPYELTVMTDVSITEKNENIEVFHISQTYAIEFNEAVDGIDTDLIKSIWPYLRTDIVYQFNKYGLPIDMVPLSFDVIQSAENND